MFEIYIDKREEFRFRLKAKNGQIILASEGYTTKQSCLNGIESVRKNSQDDSKFKLKETEKGKWQFNLVAGNGQVIGTSQIYEAEAGAKNGIESVKKNAADAKIEEVES
ncbi:YegP family protein [Vaginella massiliensis]|uniref:YegP family protein n=1 Tax=Vaginella massiliensis TaxID=1816680 RepID=UPI0037505D55